MSNKISKSNEYKVCSNTSCYSNGSPQLIENFHRTAHHSDGLSSRCKHCINAYHKGRRCEKKEYDKQYRRKNEIKIKKDKKAQYDVSAERIRERSRSWQQNNKDRIRIRERKKCNENIQYRLGRNLRIRLNKAIKNNQKSGSAVGDLGCSIEFLKQYLESLFQPGMTWENYGIRGWHIDHIRPLSSFDLSNKEELLLACNYINLQPLWANDNIRKRNHIK